MRMWKITRVQPSVLFISRRPKHINLSRHCLRTIMVLMVLPNQPSTTHAECLNIKWGAVPDSQAGTRPRCVIAHDFDGDGKTDIATAGLNNTNNLTILIGLGDGEFLPPD